ncbi:GGDEF domain-containing protein [Massilia sp. TSP1-1-2]|uniref:GGDEF domain-containing protein n=1 Tax=unclassified Massilia TaxID=2609279 RepID=UPI003CE7342C
MGDGVLVEIAARLKRTVRDTDMALRWGGEEFLIYAPDTEGDLLRTMVERLLHSVCAEPVQLGELSVPVTLTAGYIALPFSGLTEEQCSWERAIQLTDLALYVGKQNGRNRAYGLVRLTAPFDEAMAAIERDLLAASQQGLMELAEVLGPPAAAVKPTLAAA